MLGLVFSEFMDMVEEAFPDSVFDDLLETAEGQCDSRGSYTAVGKYDHVEMLTLVTRLSELTDMPIPDLVRTYGKHLFGQFHAKYPQFFDETQNAFDFLKGIEDRIHFEVRKLYPDAELPSFAYEEPSANTLIMYYESTRPFSALAHGLIEGCIAHFDEQIAVSCEDNSTDTITKAIFTLTRKTH